MTAGRSCNAQIRYRAALVCLWMKAKHASPGVCALVLVLFRASVKEAVRRPGIHDHLVFRIGHLHRSAELLIDFRFDMGVGTGDERTESAP